MGKIKEPALEFFSKTYSINCVCSCRDCVCIEKCENVCICICMYVCVYTYIQFLQHLLLKRLSTFPSLNSICTLNIYRKKERDVYFKKLAHAIVDTGKSKSASQASRLETQGRVDIAALI